MIIIILFVTELIIRGMTSTRAQGAYAPDEFWNYPLRGKSKGGRKVKISASIK